MLKIHGVKRIVSLTLAMTMLYCVFSTMLTVYAWNGPTPEVLFAEDFSSGYTDGERISENTNGKLVANSTDPDKWSAVVERVNGSGTAGNTASFKTVQDPDSTSGRGMVMAMYTETPTGSTANPAIRKFFKFNNGATAIDIRFFIKD